MPYTLVAFHAHPDDESLLMGGTIARAAAEGHRVVLVTATDGAAGLTAPTGGTEALGARRLRELEHAAAELGAARVVHLGFPDGAFGAVPLADAEAALAAVVEQESADVLTGYDPAGGYGHPDHVQVHRVARAVAARSGGLPLLEATVDRTLLLAGARLVHALPGGPGVDLDALRRSYLPRERLTHRIDVRAHVRAKQRALGAHLTQQSGGSDTRTVALLHRLPAPLARLVLGREWFAEVGAPPGRGLRDDVFSACR